MCPIRINFNYGAMGANTDEYCNICNPFQYDTSIMANARPHRAHPGHRQSLHRHQERNAAGGFFVKPSGLVDGHPASSKLNLFEGFTKKIVDAVQANPTLWNDTAIFITFDEGGGYYDSGYVQPLDYFGDGTRIPMIVVSPYSQGRTHLAQLLGSRLHPQIHRAELESESGHKSQPGQLPQSDYEPDQPVRSGQQPRDQRSL